MKMSKDGSPDNAMPSRTMSARVMSAKYSGTVKGNSKKIWLSSREIAENCARFDSIAP